MALTLLLLSLALAGQDAPLPLTTAELGRHDLPDDCWTLIDGVVYDITPWIPTHPGGDAILRACGKDATWLFHNRDEGGGHSESATALLAGFALGPLGGSTTVAEPESALSSSVHPYALRLEGSRVGLLPSAGVGPARSVALRVGHQISTGDVDSGIGMQLGYSTGWMDILVSDYRAVGLGGLELELRPLAQHGARPAPLSVSVGGGGGFSSTLDAPALYGQLVLERDLLDRRLSARVVGTGALSPGVDNSGAASVGLGLEMRPIPIHSVFGELIVPVEAPDELRWSAGARLFTRGHAFSLYVASTPALSAFELAGVTPKQLAVGGAFERAFRL